MTRETYTQWREDPPQGPGWRFGGAIPWLNDGEGDAAIIWYRETGALAAPGVNRAADPPDTPRTVMLQVLGEPDWFHACYVDGQWKSRDGDCGGAAHWFDFPVVAP